VRERERKKESESKCLCEFGSRYVSYGRERGVFSVIASWDSLINATPETCFFSQLAESPLGLHWITILDVDFGLFYQLKKF